MSDFYHWQHWQTALRLRAWRLEDSFFPPLTDAEFALLVAAWDKCWGSSSCRLYLHRPIDNSKRDAGNCDIYLIREWNSERDINSTSLDDNKISREHYLRARDFIVGFFAGLRIQNQIGGKK